MAVPDQPPHTYPTRDGGGGGGGGGSGSIIDTFPALFPLVLGGTFVMGLALAFLLLWLTRRRAKAAARAAAGGGGGGVNVDVGDEAMLLSEDGRASEETRVGVATTVAIEGGGRRKLQKACTIGAGVLWSGTEGFFGDADGEGRGWPRRHVSMPLIPRACSKGHFHFGFGGGGVGESCRWPGQGPVEMGEVKVWRRKPSWIDEDALHGPKVSGGKGLVGGGGEKKKKTDRGSWPLRNRTPTLPRLHHTIHGYPYQMSGGRDGSSEALLGESQFRKMTTSTGMGDAQLRGFSRGLPEPPKPALLVSRDRRVLKPSVSMGHVYGVSRIPQPVPSPPVSPVRSSPTSPLRHRGRQQSTDSTLSDILRSTENRLREGSVPRTIRSRRATTSPVRSSPGKVLGPREYGVPVLRARTPSPKKSVSGPPFARGDKRRDSQQSVSSETDSLLGDECPNPDVPSGLTSPSRNQKNPEAERRPIQTKSARTSLSSELSTLYSEDEMPDEVKRATMPLEGLVVQPQQASHVRAPSMNDPFVTAPLALQFSRASSVGARLTKHSKSQDLFRQSVQRSQRLHSMTVGHTRSRSQGLILAPGPMVPGPKTNVLPVIPPSRKVSVTIPRSIQPYTVSRASEPPPSPTRYSPTNQSPAGPLFLRVTKTSTLSTIPLLPPPSARGLDVFREANPKPPSPTKTTQSTGDQRRSLVLMLPSTERPSAPSSPNRRVGGELRLSLTLAPKQQLQDLMPPQNRNSASSSVYSQEANNPSPNPMTTQAAIELNRAGFQANSSLYPAPLSPRSRGDQAAPSPSSKLSSELLRSATNNKDVSSDDEEEDDTDDDTPLAITSTIASLRRMNSGISSASSLQSIVDRNMFTAPSSSLGRAEAVSVPGRTTTMMTPVGSPTRGLGGEGEERRNLHRKSIGARNYYILGSGGGGRGQSRRGSRVVSGVPGVVVGGVVKSPSGGMSVGGNGNGVGGVRGGGGGGSGGSPYKKRRAESMRHQRRVSTSLSMPATEFAAVREEGKENNGGDGKFKVAAGEFTFEVSNPDVPGKGGLGLREGSSGSVNALVMPQQKDSQRLSLAWKPADGGASRTCSPGRLGGRDNVRSVDSLGLYDGQGFLISASPVRGVSPSGLRV